MCSEEHYAVTFPAQMPLPVLQASYGTMVDGIPKDHFEIEREATIPRTQFDLYLDKLRVGGLSLEP